MSLQQSIRKSFQNVKKDIAEIKDKLQMLTEKQGQLEISLSSLQSMQKADQASDLIQIKGLEKPQKTKKKQK